jgi:hypothetical protein
MHEWRRPSRRDGRSRHSATPSGVGAIQSPKCPAVSACGLNRRLISGILARMHPLANFACKAKRRAFLTVGGVRIQIFPNSNEKLADGCHGVVARTVDTEPLPIFPYDWDADCLFQSPIEVHPRTEPDWSSAIVFCPRGRNEIRCKATGAPPPSGGCEVHRLDQIQTPSIPRWRLPSARLLRPVKKTFIYQLRITAP